jgi:predicted RNA methylase/GTP cyclohydrolase I
MAETFPEVAMALTLNQVREQYPELSGTSDEVLANFLHKNYYSDIPLEDFSKAVGLTSGDEAGDFRSYVELPFLKGTAAIGGAVGYGLEASGIAPETGRSLQESHQRAEEALTERQSQQAREDASKRLIDDEGNYGGYNAGTFAQQVFESAPGMLAMGMPGGLLARGATAGAKAVGVGSKAANTIGSALGFGASEGIFSGASNAEQIQQEIRNASFDKLVDHPAFIEAYHTETDPDAPQERRLEQARDILARKAGDDVFADTAVKTGGISALTGGGIFGMLREGRAGGLLANAGKGMLKEGILQEAPQSALEQRTSNQARLDYLDPNQDLNKGVLTAGIEGGLVGAAMGVAGGAGVRDIGKAETVDDAIAAAGEALKLPAPTPGIGFDRTAAVPKTEITFSDGSTIDAHQYFQQRKAEHGDEERARNETYQALNGKPEPAPIGLPELVFTADGRSLNKAELIKSFIDNGATEQQANDYITAINTLPVQDRTQDNLLDVYRYIQAQSAQERAQASGLLDRNKSDRDAAIVRDVASRIRPGQSLQEFLDSRIQGDSLDAERRVAYSTKQGMALQQFLDAQTESAGYVPGEAGQVWEAPNIEAVDQQAQRNRAFYEAEQAAIARKEAELDAMLSDPRLTPNQQKQYRKARVKLEEQKRQRAADFKSGIGYNIIPNQAGAVHNTQLRDQLQGLLARGRSNERTGSDAERNPATPDTSPTPTGTIESAQTTIESTAPGKPTPYTHEDPNTGEKYRFLGDDRYQDAEGATWSFSEGELEPLTTQDATNATTDIQPATQPQRIDDRIADTGAVGGVSGNDRNVSEQQQEPVQPAVSGDDTGAGPVKPQRSRLKTFRFQVDKELKGVKLVTPDSTSAARNRVTDRYREQIVNDVAEGRTFSTAQLNDIADNGFDYLLPRSDLKKLGYTDSVADQVYQQAGVAEPVATGQEATEAAERLDLSSESQGIIFLRNMPINTKEEAIEYTKAFDEFRNRYGTSGGNVRGKKWKPISVTHPDLFSKLSDATEKAELNYWQMSYEEAIRRASFHNLPKAKWIAERKKRGLPVEGEEQKLQPSPEDDVLDNADIEPEATPEREQSKSENTNIEQDKVEAPKPHAEDTEQTENKADSRTETGADREKQRKSAAKLRSVAQKALEAAKQEQSRDRATNTPKRAREAGYAINNALANEALAKTALNIADALERGEAGTLAGISSKAQVEQMNNILKAAIGLRDAKRFNSYAEQQRHEGRKPEPEDIAFAKYPVADMHPEHVPKFHRELREIRGGKKLSASIHGGTINHDQYAQLKKLVGEKKADDMLGWFPPEQLKRQTRLKRMGINNQDDLEAVLSDFLKFKEGMQAEDKVKVAERALVGQKLGVDFFPTPKATANKMVELAGIERGMRVLEPSAGNGNLADAAKEAGATVEAIEISDALRNVLDAKGYKLVGRNFNDFEPDSAYDAIIMNPPFSNGQDAEHIERAYGMLKPGGRLVAIAGEGVFFRSDAKSKAFREWLDENGAEVEKLPEKTFQDKTLINTTGVNARLVVIEKPLSKEATNDIKFSKNDTETGQFLDGRAKPIQREVFDNIREGVDSEGARAARAGAATTRQGILIQSTVSSESGERSGVLEHVLHRDRALDKGSDLGSASSPNTPKTGTSVDELRSWLPKRVNKLVEANKLHIVQSAREIPDNAQAFEAAGAEAFYKISTDELFMIADNITKENFKSVLNHELFHRLEFTDKRLREEIAFFDNALERRFNLAAKGGGSKIEKAAYRRVMDAHVHESDYLTEFKAYLVSEYSRDPDTFFGTIKKIIQDFIAAIRAAMIRVGVPVQMLTPADLTALAKYGARVKDESVSSDNKNTLRSAQAQGYKGTNTGEAEEWLRAKAKGLDMSKKARMARAKSMGFFTNSMMAEDMKGSSSFKGDDELQVWYHGGPADWDMSGFKEASGSSFYDPGNIHGGFAFLTSSKGEAKGYADELKVKKGIKTAVHEFYVKKNGPSKAISSSSGKNLPSYKDLQKQGFGQTIVDLGKYGKGNDDTYYRHEWMLPYAANQIRSIHAAFDPDYADSGNLLASINDDVRYSRTAQDSATVAAAKRKAGLGPKRTLAQAIQDIISLGWSANAQALKERWQALKPQLEQGVFDKFLGIKLAEQEILGEVAHSQSGYIGARLSTGSSSTMQGLLLFGSPEWRDGIIQKKAESKGFAEILQPVKDDIENFTAWMVGRRADRLFREGKENNFTRAEIDALLALKQDSYQGVADDIAAMNKAVLDLAQESGLVDAQSRRLFEHSDYIPFFRLVEGVQKGPRNKQGLSHQTSGIKALKGGENPLSDPLGNMMQNWAHLIDASMKNDALNKTLTNLEGSRFVEPIPRVEFKQAMIPKEQIKKLMQEAGLPDEIIDAMPGSLTSGIAKLWAMQAPTDPDVVRVMRDGKSEYFRVQDGMLLTSLTAVNQSQLGGVFKSMRYMKHLLTAAITADPTFMARNFIRDSMHSWTIAEEKGFKLGLDSFHGAIKSMKEEGGYVDMMFAGASFQGGYGNYNNPDSARESMDAALRRRGIHDIQGFHDSILDTPKKYWEMYRSVGDAIENANREAILENAKRSGAEKAQYLFEAKDIMDFSMQGSFTLIRAMSDMLPFFNARLVGLYRLAKAGKTDQARRLIIAKGLSISFMTLALLALNSDNEDYEALEDFDKDQYWHFFIGDQHYRIPKPFELGLIFGTVPERAARAMIGKDTLKDFGKRMAHGAGDTLAFNPVPQLFKPFVELYSNKNMFTGRPIEGMADEGKLPSARYNEHTSETMRVLSSVLPESLGASPKRLEHLMSGYLGAMGMYALGVSDMMVRSMADMPELPEQRIDRLPVIKGFYQEQPALHTKYGTQLYEMLSEVNQIHRTINAYKKEGNIDKARELLQENASKLRSRKALDKSSKSLSEIRKRIDAIYRSDLGAEEKRRRIDALMMQANKGVQRVVRATSPYFN